MTSNALLAPYSVAEIEEAISYRKPMQIVKVRKYPRGTTYPVCPRCNSSMDREYMSFCDRCGQKLNWHSFEEAVVERIR